MCARKASWTRQCLRCLVGAVSGNQVRIAGTIGSVSNYLNDSSPITDMAYLAAINGVILRKAFEIAADIAEAPARRSPACGRMRREGRRTGGEYLKWRFGRKRITIGGY